MYMDVKGGQKTSNLQLTLFSLYFDYWQEI